ncbi:MAG: sterol desaturase family protein [Proteobacteria bacterium]|nr:sterol desaturase family protein [Pseudomonadota bacterium]
MVKAFFLLLLLRILILTRLERANPAHPISYRDVWRRDAVAGLVFAAAVFPAAMFVDNHLPLRPPVPDSLMSLPLLARFAIYLVVADFGHYWVHRLLHTAPFWRAHKWHHYPTYMYWLAGDRGSIIQQILVNVPYIFAGVLLDVGPWWIALVLATKNTLQNDWMHLNVPWGNRWSEWFIVTPRYHHIHHSDDPQHYKGNLAALFTLWDRLFGTYVDPDSVPRELKFGIGEQPTAIRLVIGV